MTHVPEVPGQGDAVDTASDHQETSPAQTPHTAGRRTLLMGAGLSVAGLSVLAACGGGGDQSGAASPGGDNNGGSSDTASSVPSSDGDGDESKSAGGDAGDFSVAASSVPVGGGFIDTKAKVVVTQPTAGTYKGFTAVCTHRGCTVAKVEDGVISCPCHGSEFSATDGTVKQGPANSPLASVSVKKSGSNIVKG